MAAPNLKSPTTITGKTARYAVTASIAAALSNASSSGKVLKINSLIQAEINNGSKDYDSEFVRKHIEKLTF